MWGEFQLPPHIGGAVGGAVGALAPPKAPLRRVRRFRVCRWSKPQDDGWGATPYHIDDIVSE